MKPEEQKRVQRRMQSWAKLTPEQRRQARENYKQHRQGRRPSKRGELREQWAEYQALPPQERWSAAELRPADAARARRTDRGPRAQ